MPDLFETVCFRTGNVIAYGVTQEEADMNAVAAGAKALVFSGPSWSDAAFCEAGHVTSNIFVYTARPDDPIIKEEGAECIRVEMDADPDDDDKLDLLAGILFDEYTGRSLFCSASVKLGMASSNLLGLLSDKVDVASTQEAPAKLDEFNSLAQQLLGDDIEIVPMVPQAGQLDLFEAQQ